MKVQPFYGADKESGSVEYSNVLRVEITNTVFKSNGRIKETFFYV